LPKYAQNRVLPRGLHCATRGVAHFNCGTTRSNTLLYGSNALLYV